MKNIKTYERFKFKTERELYLNKSDVKRYIITNSDNEYFLDEIIRFDTDEIKVKILYFFSAFDDIFSNAYGADDTIAYHLLDDLVFTSDDKEEAVNYLEGIVDMYKNSNKYNL